MESDGDTPPFWSQSNTTHPLLPRRHRLPPSQLLNPVTLILAVPILLFFIVPPFLSHATQILKPNSVKKGWDYFNVLLVFFAILCGVFARRNDDVSSSDDAPIRPQNSDTISNVSNFVNEPRHSVTTWLEFPDQKEYNSVNHDVSDAPEEETGGGRLKRSSSSYPDLRQESLWESEDENRSRFFDDFEVNFSQRDYLHRWGRRIHETEIAVREIPVDTFEVSSAPPALTPPKSPPPPPPPPPLPSADILKQRRSYQSVPQKEEIEKQINVVELGENQEVAPPPEQATPPSQPEAEEFQFPEVISDIVTRKKSGATKEFASAMALLYKAQKRNRKKKVKSREIYENAPQNSSPPSSLAPPPQSVPPTPPPPPPPNVFQNLLKKSSKSKRVVPTTVPPPPPPPPNSIFNNLFKTGQSKRFQSSSTTPPPPPPPPPPPSSILNSLFKSGGNIRRFKEVNTTPLPPPPTEPPRRRRGSISGKPPKPPRRSTEYMETPTIAPPSPFIPMPPPFKIPNAKFIAQGDYVRIRSADSYRCSSPELENYAVMSVKSEAEESSRPSITCPSPDVNTKADNFIARLRDEWKMEKMNSMKEKRTLG